MDIGRTHPSEPLFRRGAGRKMLARILKAIASMFPEVGYCQGMNFVVGAMLLMLSGPDHDAAMPDADLKSETLREAMTDLENTVFWVMAGLLKTR
jgi:hypothetical protein